MTRQAAYRNYLLCHTCPLFPFCTCSEIVERDSTYNGLILCFIMPFLVFDLLLFSSHVNVSVAADHQAKNFIRHAKGIILAFQNLPIMLHFHNRDRRKQPTVGEPSRNKKKVSFPAKRVLYIIMAMFVGHAVFWILQLYSISCIDMTVEEQITHIKIIGLGPESPDTLSGRGMFKTLTLYHAIVAKFWSPRKEYRNIGL